MRLSDLSDELSCAANDDEPYLAHVRIEGNTFRLLGSYSPDTTVPHSTERPIIVDIPPIPYVIWKTGLKSGFILCRQIPKGNWQAFESDSSKGERSGWIDSAHPLITPAITFGGDLPAGGAVNPILKRLLDENLVRGLEKVGTERYTDSQPVRGEV